MPPMSSPFKNKSFIEQKKIWYQKLKEGGFVDVEKNENKLHLYESVYFYDPRRMLPEVIEARQNYYRLAGQFFNTHPFKNAFDRKVWGMYSEGLAIRDIATKLNRPGLKDKIQLALRRLEAEMINKAKVK